MENMQQLPIPQTPEAVTVPSENKIFSLPILIASVVTVTAILAGGIGYYFGSMQKTKSMVNNTQFTSTPIPETENTACTMDAKLCPDGSFVGRSGPSCEFASCSARLNIEETISKFTSQSGKISMDIPPDWRIKEVILNPNKIVEFQGPKQLLMIYENTKPEHAFDDYKTETTTVLVAGKSFPATKWTSLSWGNSFIEVKVQEEPYLLYLEFGDAASVGFQGYNQEYEERVDFQSDIKPILEALKTFSY